MSHVVQSNGASRHNLQSISTINSNLNQLSDQTSQLANFRNEPGMRAPAYAANLD
jgi:X-X-X-Leu-X-X-Gly heptad repeat protein